MDTQLKTTIFRDGSKYFLYGDVGLTDSLPNKVLEVKTDPFNNVYLEESAPISLPEKIYSNDAEFIEHVLKSYESTTSSLGILLNGKKGLGKSFTANVICSRLNLPIIKITHKLSKDVSLFNFLEKITQEHVVLIDEFEKNFSTHTREDGENKNLTQSDFLSYLDNGSLSTKRLFIITANEEVSQYLLNRPSRIRYHRSYETMHERTISEIVDDLLVNTEFKDDLVENVSPKYVNIDVLIRIIEEVNLHNKPYSSFKDFFNFSNGTVETYDAYSTSGSLMREEIDVQIPLRKDTVLYWDAVRKTEIYVKEVLNKTRTESRISVYWDNPKFYDESSEDEYLYETLILKKKYGLLL